MKKEKLLELFKKGTNFSFNIPAGTKVDNITQALALYIIETSKYRGIKSATAVAEIAHWVTQLEENL